MAVDPDGHKLVTWRMLPGFEPSAPIDFNVEYARSGGEFSVVNPEPLTDQCFFIDPAQYDYNCDRDSYYRISFTYDGQDVVSEPVRAGAYFDNRHDWLLAREMVRRNYLSVKKYGGLRGQLLKRKRWGTRCTNPDCLDWDTKEVARRLCPTCAGTGIVGGYYPPIEMWVKETGATPNPTKKMTEMNLSQAITLEVSTPAWPWIETRDVWVNLKNNERFIIEAVAPCERFAGIDIVWKMAMSLMPQSLSEALHSAEVNYIVENPAPPSGTDGGWRPKLDLEF